MANSSRIVQILEMLKETPDDPFLNYALAIEYVGKGDDTAAKSIFEDLIHKLPEYHASYYHLAKLYERMGKNEAAVSCYEAGLEITKRLNEKHAYNELKSALDELLY